MAKYKSLRQMSDAEAAIRVAEDFTRYEAAKQKSIKRCRRYEAVYKALNNPDLKRRKITGKIEDDPGLFSNTYMPIGAAIADALVAKLFNAFFNTPHYFRMSASEFEDKIRAFKVTGHLMKRHSEMCFIYTIFQALLQAACFDYAITGVRWLLKEGHVNRRKEEKSYRQYGRLRIPFEKVQLERVWVPNAVDRSDVFLINYFDCYHDPDSKNGFEDSEAFIDVSEMKIETFKMNAKTADRPWGKYKNVGPVLREWAKDNAEFLNKTKAKKLSDQHKANLINNRRITVTRYWTPDHIIEMAKGKVIWRRHLTGWALQRWVIFDEAEPQFPGMGILQRMERNQYDINDSINNRRDFEHLITDPIAVVDEGIIGPEGEPELYHGKTFVNTTGKASKDTIFIHSPGSNIGAAMGLDLSAQMDAIEKVTISENLLGAYKGGRRTATETIKVGQGTDNKTTLRAKLLEAACLEPIYNEQFALEGTLLSTTERFTYFGRQGEYVLAIRPEDYAFRRQPAFHAMGSLSMMNEPIEIQQFMLAMKQAMMMPEIHNWPNIFAEMWNKLVPRHHDSFVKDPRVKEDNVPPGIENLLFSQGRTVEVSPQNDHRKHIPSHEAVKGTADYAVWPELFKRNLDEHIAAHHKNATVMSNMVTQRPGSEGTQDSSDPLRGLRPTMMQGGE